MNASRLGTVLIVGVLVAGVAFVGPAMAHGDETTAPTNETVNDTHWNDSANTWTDHADAWNDRSVPTWMASHMSQADYDWMASAMGFGPQERPDTPQQQPSTDGQQQTWADGHQQAWSDDQEQTWTDSHQQAWNDSNQTSPHQQSDDRPGTTMGGQHGHGF